MTISTDAALLLGGTNQQSWGTELDSSSDSPLEKKGAIRWDLSDTWGLRGFQYLRCDQSGGCTSGQLQSFGGGTTITNITAGTTTTITTSGLTADIHVGGILYCTDDAGGAGAAPEGEMGRVIANTATLVTIDKNDAFTAAPAANDDFLIINPFSVNDSADGDFAGGVAGVAMAGQDQYDWGWFQFFGLNPNCDIVAAGTALPVGESLVADAALLTDGAGDAVDLRVGIVQHPVASDTVLRKALVDLYCGAAFKISNSTA